MLMSKTREAREAREARETREKLKITTKTKWYTIHT